MAYQPLVVEELTADFIQEGARLLQSLDTAGIPVTAALWLLRDEAARWRLVLASPAVAQHGELAFYGKVWDILHAGPDTELSAIHVQGVRPDNELIVCLSKTLHTVPGIQKIRFTRSAANGVMIPDALIYRLP